MMHSYIINSILNSLVLDSLNPCCNGWCTRTGEPTDAKVTGENVLILVVMDDALVRIKFVLNEVIYQVLILVVMDDALVRIIEE